MLVFLQGAGGGHKKSDCSRLGRSKGPRSLPLSTAHPLVHTTWRVIRTVINHRSVSSDELLPPSVPQPTWRCPRSFCLKLLKFISEGALRGGFLRGSFRKPSDRTGTPTRHFEMSSECATNHKKSQAAIHKINIFQNLICQDYLLQSMARQLHAP